MAHPSNRVYPNTRRQEREYLISILEQGTLLERIWLPFIRLVHKCSKNSDTRHETASHLSIDSK